jgi:hypothetical protein
MPAHIKAALLPVSLQVPVRAGGWCWARGRASTLSNIATDRISAGRVAFRADRTCRRGESVWPPFIW